MGAAIAKMSEQDIAETHNERYRCKKFAVHAAFMLRKQRALDVVQNGIAVGSAKTLTSDKKCLVKKTIRNNSKVEKK